MLRFQWDSLRRGDHILVHDASRPDLGLRAAEVVLIDTQADGGDAGPVVRPGRFAVHVDPVGEETACWRCAELPLAA